MGVAAARVCVDTIEMQNRGLERQALLRLPCEVERIFDHFEERKYIHRGNPGTGRLGIAIRVEAEASVLVGKLR